MPAETPSTDREAIARATNRLRKLRDAACLAIEVHANAARGSSAVGTGGNARHFWRVEGDACIASLDEILNMLSSVEEARAGTIPSTDAMADMRWCLLHGIAPSAWNAAHPGASTRTLDAWFEACQGRIDQLASACAAGSPTPDAPSPPSVGGDESRTGHYDVRLGVLAYPSMLLAAHLADVTVAPSKTMAAVPKAYFIAGLQSTAAASPSTGGMPLAVRDAHLVGCRVDSSQGCLMRGGFDALGALALEVLWLVPRHPSEDNLLKIRGAFAEQPRWKALGDDDEASKATAVSKVQVQLETNSHVVPGDPARAKFPTKSVLVELPSRTNQTFLAISNAHIRPAHFGVE